MLARQPKTQALFKGGTVEPFLRWAGGKRRLAQKLAPILSSRLRGTYFEPFLGAGAMFFAVAPTRAVLSDLNADLIRTFRMVAEHPVELLEAIRDLPVDDSTYYQMREDEPADPFLRAVRFVYLNRTCYGGIYRENKQGKFNVPYGGGSRTPAPLWEGNLLHRAGRLLSGKHVSLEVCDFEQILENADPGDVVYCDPVYRAVKRSQFDRYGAFIFSWEDQVRLANAAMRAVERGVLVVISNAYYPEVGELYTDALRLQLEKAKAIGSAPKERDRRKEYLIVLDPGNKADDWRTIGIIED